MTMNLNLGPQLEERVRQKVASGQYASISEVLSEGLRLIEERDRQRAAMLEHLRQDIREGLESGEPLPWNPEEIKRECHARRAAYATSDREA